MRLKVNTLNSESMQDRTRSRSTATPKTNPNCTCQGGERAENASRVRSPTLSTA